MAITVVGATLALVMNAGAAAPRSSKGTATLKRELLAAQKTIRSLRSAKVLSDELCEVWV